jgi:5-oxoprolinase (ATP-hydrolysing)
MDVASFGFTRARAGGTSTDVSRYDGQYELVFETTTAGPSPAFTARSCLTCAYVCAHTCVCGRAGVSIQAPQLDINTVAAGGGSMLFFRNGMFVVGPDSAGAEAAAGWHARTRAAPTRSPA